MSFEVRELNENDEIAFLKGFNEWKGEDHSWYSFEFKFNDDFLLHIERLRKNKLGVDLNSQFVPSTMFYGFIDGEIIGRVSVRHHLNEYLNNVGGHIGYSVAPRFRGNGYAKKMLMHALNYSKVNLKLEVVLVTCDDDNLASIKVIENFKFCLENTIMDQDTKKLKRRYWISL